ncbi:MAG: hypothetical protein ACTSVY_00595 [Candidatus Helarchaeota archaeon]
MIFGLLGIVIILKSKYKEKVSFFQALVAIYIPEILLLILALAMGNGLTYFESNIVLTDAMKISYSLFIMLVVFLIGSFFVYSSDLDNSKILLCALPLVAVLTNLFSIHRVVYFFYPIIDNSTFSTLQLYLFYLQQEFLKGSIWYTIPFDFIYWCIDLGVLLVSIIYAIRRFAYYEVLERQKLLEAETRKQKPFQYPNIKPGEFEEFYFEEKEED